MSETELGEMPEPTIEPGEVNPGGVDALPESDGVEAQDSELLTRDLSPDANPAVDAALPDEVRGREDTSTEATTGDGESATSHSEDPA